MTLPQALDELAGLRAARWVRESTRGQYDTFGPDAQREQQDRAVERYGLVDSGVSWNVAHSGRTVGTTTQFADMLGKAGHEYDVLVVGYVSRFTRDLRTTVNARHDLHAAGAAILFVDEQVLSSDENVWEQFAREAVEAEAYSRRLGKRISEGYAAKFRRLGDPAGNPPWGFRRTGPAHVMEPDPEVIENVVHAFERYAAGNVTHGMLADEFGVGVEQVRKALRNPIYNGWAERHRGLQRVAASWRADPPVDDVLWERVQAVRDIRTNGGPKPGKWRRSVDPLGGLLWCVCGVRIRTNGTAGQPPRRQRIHPAPVCGSWGGPRTTWGATHDEPIDAQLSGLRLSDAVMARVVGAVGEERTEATPDTLDAARLARRRRELALDHAAGRVDDETYLASVHALRTAPDVIRSNTTKVSAGRAVEYLRDLAALWPHATESERSELLHAIYARITVTRDGFDSVELTPDANAHGMALAMPETVVASPAGFEPATGRLEGGCSVH
jgi:DNA invertase Pin-like site-specific DNA recombinase